MVRPVFAQWAVFALALLLFPSSAPAQDLQLATDSRTRYEFSRLEAYERERNWWPLIRGLDRLLAKKESTVFKRGRRFVSVRGRARAWLLELSRVPEARRAYDFAHGDSARALLEAGVCGTSLEPLEELIARYPASEHAPFALELLVSRSVERGELGLARVHLDRLRAHPRIRVEDRPRLARLGAQLDALAARSRPSPRTPVVSQLAWQRRVFGFYDPDRDPSPPRSFPRSDGSVLYAHDASHARALDLRTGKLLWRVPLHFKDTFLPPAGPCHLALAPKTVVCLLPGKDGLVGLDRRTGRMLWRLALQELAEAADVQVDEAGPIVAIGKVAALTVFARNGSVHVLGLTPGTGALRWKALIASRTTRGLPRPALTRGAGRLFVVTGLGVIAALDPYSGELLWVRRYRSLWDRDPKQYASMARQRTRGHDGFVGYRSSLVESKGRVWVAPADAEVYYAWDASTGRLIGRKTAQTGGKALGSSRIVGPWGAGVVVLSPKGELHAISLRGSRRIARLAQVDFAARPSVAAGKAYVPCRTGVVRVDLASAKATQVLRWDQARQSRFGNLHLAGGRLVVVRPGGIDAYGTPIRTRRRRVTIRTVLRMLGDRSYSRREQAQRILLAKGEPIRRALTAFRRHPAPEVRLRVRELICALDRRALLDRIEPLIEADWRARVPKLLERLVHSNSEIRLKTMVQLADVGDPDVLAVFRHLLRDSDRRVSLTAAMTLLQRGDSNGLDRLAWAVRRGTRGDKLTTINLLGGSKRPEHARLLLPALDDPDRQVRTAAASAMLDLGAFDALTQVRARPEDLEALSPGLLSPSTSGG